MKLPFFIITTIGWFAVADPVKPKSALKASTHDHFDVSFSKPLDEDGNQEGLLVFPSKTEEEYPGDVSIESNAAFAGMYDRVRTRPVQDANMKRKRVLSYMYQCEPATGDEPACTGVNFGYFAAGNNTCIGNSACLEAGKTEQSFTAGDNSCWGEFACRSVGHFHSGESTCQGSYACDLVNNFFAGKSACVGNRACAYASRQGSFFAAGDRTCFGFYACNRAAYKGMFQAAEGTCQGRNSCAGVAYGSLSQFHAGDGACVGESACSDAANSHGEFKVGNGSCHGTSACSDVADTNGASFTTGYSSCLGERACYGILKEAENEFSAVVIGDASCVGSYACTTDSASASFTIGENSCQCDGCCENLKDGSTIGDCQCNTLEDNCSNQADPVVKVANACFQQLTFNESTHMLGLTVSEVQVSLDGLVNDDENELQELIFDDAANKLSLTNSTNAIDLSHLVQELTYDDQNQRLGLKDSGIGVDLSALLQEYQHLTFDMSTNMLGLTNSNATVNLTSLVKDSMDEIQHLDFDHETNQLMLDNSKNVIDLSHLDKPPQELQFDYETKRLELTDSNEGGVDLSLLAQGLNFNTDTLQLELTDSNSGVDLSMLAQGLSFDNATMQLELTESNDTIDLSLLAQDLKFDNVTMQLELTGSSSVVDLSPLAQDLKFNNSTMQLELTESDSAIDLSPLQLAQDLKFNAATMQLELTESDSAIDLSPFAQDLTLNDDNHVEISAGGKGVDLSSLRVAFLQATVVDIDGDETSTGTGRRRMKGGKDKFPIVKYGGEDTGGWTTLTAGRLVGMTITARYRLTEGILKVGIADCSDINSVNSLVSLDDALTLVHGGKRSHVVKFNPPIPVDGGDILCFETIRIGDVESQEKDNAASLVLMLEQW